MARKQKFDYFDAFRQLSALAVEEADLLVSTIENFPGAAELPSVMDKAHEIEHKGDMINHDIFQNAATDFITPIDREDIIDLAQNLDNVIDLAEDVIQRCYMYDVHTVHEGALEFAQIIRKSCGALNEAMEDFANFKKSTKFKQLIIDVNSYEEEADRLLLKVTRKLYTEEKEAPMRVLVWSQIYARLEKCSDACEHVADDMSTILMKNV